MPTAFVFAGGGSLGAIQVGALREIIRAGERPDFVVGASVGALNACYYAGHPDLDGIARLESIWTNLRRRDVFPVTAGSLLDFARGGSSIFAHDGLRKLIEEYVPFRNLEAASIPVHVVATNLSGTAITLSKGSSVEAILASAAIPIAFPSVRIGMDDLIDGAIAGNTPILTAASLGADRIIVLQTGYACSMNGPPGSSVARGMHALTLLVSNQLERDMQLLHGQATIHLAPHLCPLTVSPFNFSQGAALITRAADATAAWIASGGLASPSRAEDFQHDHAGMSMQVFQYDLVSYFDPDGTPREGRATHAADFRGMTYLFDSAANRDRFTASPESFLPQYGGACAYAMARNKSVVANPLVFAVIDGKLYFNRDQSVHTTWRRNADREIAGADANWALKFNISGPV